MKNIIIKGLFAALMLLFCVASQAQTSKNPVGKWDYSIPDVSSEYSSGKAEFKNQNNKLMLVLSTGGWIGDAFEMTKKDDSYSGKFLIEGYAITVTLKPDGENLKGTLSSDRGTLVISMKPEKK